MSKGVIFNFFEHCPKSLMSFLVFAFAGLTFLCNQLNFNIPASRKVRDAADFTTPFSEVAKLEPRSAVKGIASTYTSAVPTAGYYTPASYTSFAGVSAQNFHIAEPTPVSNPAIDAGYGVMRYMGYGGRFLYGHSSLAFSPIKSLYVGNTFTATIDGVTATYRVSQRYVFNKASDLDGTNNNARRTRIYSARDENNTRHSLALMTCGNGGNNDSNYRLVLFADAI